MTTGSHPTPVDPLAPPGSIVVQICARTDVGRSREHNEDSYLVTDLAVGEPLRFDDMLIQRASDRGTLFMVADGMGGAAAGEIASEMATEVVLQQMRGQWSDADPADAKRFVAALREATEAANTMIHHFAVEHPEYRGMGTTATLAGLLGDTLYLAQVGDSRAYLVRDGVARQITKDQSLMQKLVEAGEISPEEAELSERRNIILQALGPEPTIKIDLTHQRVRRGDVLILCSDGLSSLVRPESIARVVDEEISLDRVCDRLIALANDAGGPDNITVVCARFDGSGLDVADDADSVGHQVYGTPTEVTPIALDVVLPAPEAPVSSNGDAPPSAPPAELQEGETEEASAIRIADEERRRRGMRYTRAIAAAGVIILLLIVWQIVRRFWLP